MGKKRLLASVLSCLALSVCAPAAAAGAQFHPHIGHALGVVPAFNDAQDIATGAPTPLTYHGGQTMTGGVTVHTIFWAPSGYSFQPSPGGAVPSYETLIQQFFTDLAHDSSPVATGSCTTTECAAFTVLNQYGWGTSPGGVTAGSYDVSYDASTDSIDDTDAYPAAADQCASPDNIGTCLTDVDVQNEIDHEIGAGGARGLHNVWLLFLPPNVDECVLPGECGSNVFGAYHSVSDVLNHGVVIYGLVVDPTIEGEVAPGADPEGFPDAEIDLDYASHELAEAITDPEGAGWYNPNDLEVGDMCETGPQTGNPLGVASDDSPYDQVINGDKYLLQELWSNDDNACVQATTATSDPLPLPQVNLTQFSSTITGNTENDTGGIGVQVTLLRADPSGNAVPVAQASATTASDGSWSVTLPGHAVGDDRDEIDVDYSETGAPVPNNQVILTGNGGNPTSSAGTGWMGWFDMDTGSLASNVLGPPTPPWLMVGPCFEVGALSATFDGNPLGGSLNDLCGTETETATESTASIDAADTLTWTSNDNRAFSPPGLATENLDGGLVSLTVPVGEADSFSPFVSGLPDFFPGGFPSCTADLEMQTVTCTGLVPGDTYTVIDGAAQPSAIADNTGTITVSLAAHGGDSVSLSNGSRTLTTLHVANLRVDITGEETVLSGGSCQPGDYYGPPLSSPPDSLSAGFPSAIAGGAALTGEICPTSGDAAGLPTSSISQTDDFSGGQTQTEVPDVENTSPMDGETMYGGFAALAQSGLPGPNNSVIPTDATSAVAVSIAPASGGSPVFTSSNVDTVNGVSVPVLPTGTYTATWTLTDVNGDTRTATTRFIEQSALQGPQGSRGPQGAQGTQGPPGSPGPKPKISCKLTGKHRNLIKCKVTVPKSANDVSATVRMSITRGTRVAALGHGRLSHGAATVTMREVRRLKGGAWKITLVIAQAHKPAETVTLALRLR